MSILIVIFVLFIVLLEKNHEERYISYLYLFRLFSIFVGGSAAGILLYKEDWKIALIIIISQIMVILTSGVAPYND